MAAALDFLGFANVLAVSPCLACAQLAYRRATIDSECCVFLGT